MNENPYDQNPSLFFDLFKKRHICPTYWSYAKETDKMKTEFMLEEDCINGCCSYCYGHDYNEMFAEKPTDEQVYKKIEECKVRCDVAARQRASARKAKLYEGDKHDGLFVTMSIDKAYLQIPKLCEDIMAELKQTQYKDITDGLASLELWSGGNDESWNPHIHILTRKSCEPGALAQTLRRKFVKDKWQIYRINVVNTNYNNTIDYIDGVKEGAKLPYVEKDIKYRNENNLAHRYELSP